MIYKKLIWLVVLLVFFACKREIKEPLKSKGLAGVFNPVLEERPNILWLVAEDLSPSIPAFGDSTVVTPTLNRLAKEGVCYDNFYSPHPVCAPARASIITGMYATHISASNMRTGPWYSDNVSSESLNKAKKQFPEGVVPYEAIPPAEVKMFTEYLRAEGYYCTNNAKQDYQFRKTMTAWDESSNTAHWRNGPINKPFFAVFNFGVTHESRIWRKMNDSLWIDDDLTVPIPPYLPDSEIGRRDVRRMYSNLLEMDDQVGKIIGQLEEDGLLEKTIIVWYTDHGGPLPRQKRMLHDSGLKVPMIIRFPKKQFANNRDGRMISFIDLAPTMLSLIGMEPKKYMDGSAFLGSYLREEEPIYAFGAADRFDGVYDRNRTVRDNQFRYIKYYMPEKPMYLDVAYRRQMPVMQELLEWRDSGKLDKEQALWFRTEKPQEELFDLWNDPHEIHNLAENPEYKEKLHELRRVHNEWVSDGMDTGLMEERDLLKQLWPNGVQPETEPPVISITKNEISITSKTIGASIGYKLIDGNTDINSLPWNIYSGTFKITPGIKVIAVAHRIGFVRSGEVILDMPL